MEILAVEGDISPPPEGNVPLGDSQVRSRPKKRRPSIISIEEQANDLRKERDDAHRHPGEGSSRSTNADRADYDRSGAGFAKKPRKSSGKANESPYGMPGRGGRGGRTPSRALRPVRADMSVPARYHHSSSPTKSNGDEGDIIPTPRRLEGFPAPTGRRQSIASQHKFTNSPSGRATHTHHEDGDDGDISSPPDRAAQSSIQKAGARVRPKFLFSARPKREAEASSSRPPPSSSARSPRSGPQCTPITVSDDSDEGGDLDEENRAPHVSAPPRVSHNSSPSIRRRRLSNGHAQLSSVQPVPRTGQGRYQSPSSRGPSMERERPREGNPQPTGSRSPDAEDDLIEITAVVNEDNEASKALSKARAGEGHPRALSHGINGNGARDEDEDEGVEDIEQFDLSQGSGRARGPASKGKEKERAAQSPQQHVPKPPAPAPRRKAMQGKDGKVHTRDGPQQRKSVSPSKPSSSTLPSSRVAMLGDVQGCYVGSMDNPLKVTKVGLHQDKLVFMFGNELVLFRLDSVDDFCKCNHADVPTIGVELSLRPAELANLQKHARCRLESPKLSVVFEAVDDPDTRRFFDTPDYGFLGGLRQRDLINSKFTNDDVSASGYLKNSAKARLTNKRNLSPVAPKRSLTNQRDRPARSEASRLAGVAAAKRSAGQVADHKMKAVRQAKDKEAGERQSQERQTKLQLVQYEDNAPRRSTRSRTANPPRRLGDGHTPSSDEDDWTLTSTRRKSKTANADKTKLLFHLYGLDITMGERLRLEENDFLNDTCLEFGLRFTEDRKMPEAMREMVYCFNSFFYTKLTEKGPPPKSNDDPWPAYDHVKRWTKKVNIFAKKFIMVPVNEQLHWYLAVIYNPGATIDKAIADAAGRAAAGATSPRALGATDGLESRSSRQSSRPSDEEAVSRGVAPSRTGSPCPQDDVDPIDILGKEDHCTAELSEGVKDLHFGPPQPIESPTWNEFMAQGASPTAEPAMSKPPSLSPTKPTGRKPRGEDREILRSDKTWIFTFDSLPGRHPGVANCLKRWLELEARDKRNMDIDVKDIQYVSGKCPTQPNFSDCGLYLIHFVERLLNNSEDILHFIGRARRAKGDQGFDEYESHMRRVWNPPQRPEDLRHNWLQTIDDETGAYQSLHPDGKTAFDQDDEDDQPLFDDAPVQSQLSIQSVSQPWANAGSESTSAECAFGSHASERNNLAPESTATSSQRLPKARSVPLPEKEDGALKEDCKSRPASHCDSGALSAPSRGNKESNIQLSDDSDSEEEEEEPLEEPARARLDEPHAEPNLYQDDHPRIGARPTINPQDKSHSSQGGEDSSSLTNGIPGTVLDECRDDGMDVNRTPSDPRCTPQASTSHQLQPQSSPINPLEGLGDCTAIHSEFSGGGRMRKRQRHSNARDSSPSLSLALGSGFQDPHRVLVPSSSEDFAGREDSQLPRPADWAHVTEDRLGDTPDLHNGVQDQVAPTLVSDDADDGDAPTPQHQVPTTRSTGRELLGAIDNSSVDTQATELSGPLRCGTRASSGQQQVPSSRQDRTDDTAASSISKQPTITIDDETPCNQQADDELSSPVRRTRASNAKSSGKGQTPDSPPVRRHVRASTANQKQAFHESDEEAGTSKGVSKPRSTSIGAGKSKMTAANYEGGSSIAPLEIDTDGDRERDHDDEPSHLSRSGKSRTGTSSATKAKRPVTRGQSSSIHTVQDSSDEDDRPKSERTRVFARKLKESQETDRSSFPPPTGQRPRRQKKADKVESPLITPLPLSPSRDATAGPSTEKAGSARYPLRGGKDDPLSISDEDDGITESPMVPDGDHTSSSIPGAKKRRKSSTTYGGKNKRTKTKGAEDARQTTLAWFAKGDPNEGRRDRPFTLNSESSSS